MFVVKDDIRLPGIIFLNDLIYTIAMYVPRDSNMESKIGYQPLLFG